MKKKLLTIALSLVVAAGTAMPTAMAKTKYDTSDETLYNNAVEFASQYEYHEGNYEKSASLYPDVPYSSGIETTKDGKEYELPIYYNDKDAGIVNDYDLKTGTNAKVSVNGKSSTTSAYALHNDVLLLPASVFEKLGCKVSFDKKLYVTTISKSGTTLEILPQLRAMRKDKADGFYVPLQAPARFINDVVYVPAEAVAYEFGYGTDWNKSKKQVTFTEGKATPKATAAPQATATPQPTQTPKTHNSSKGVASKTRLFTDMDDTEASVLLSRLGIISGYEDGTFRPDNEVTRAETAAIIIRALRDADEDFIEDYKKEITKPEFNANRDVSVSKFSDYSPSHWANVYIQLGIDNGFISGFDDNTFRPEDKVTVDQLLTMLVNAVGYKTYAEGAGGYPMGYRQWAMSTGIMGSIEDIKKDIYSGNATRKQVLECVRNAMDAPICVISSYETTWDGTIAPMMEIKDDVGADYQTLLTHMHSIYTVDAKVTDNSKTIETDILNAVNFDDKEVKESNKLSVKLSTNKDSVNDITDTGKYKMFIRVNDSDEKDYELIYAFPAE